MTIEEFKKLFPCCGCLNANRVIDIMKNHDIRKKSAFDYYQIRTKDRYIAIQVGEYTFFVGGPGSFGNKKISNCCYVTKLTPVETCPNHKDCAYDDNGKGACYAILDTVRFNELFFLQLLYTYLAIVDPVRYCKIIEREIENSGCPFVRIHESGDFFSQTYVDAWMDLIERHPEIEFYTYTKTDNFTFRNLSNLNIVDSLIWINGKSYINYGSKEYIDWLHELTGIPICPYGKDEIKCMGKCKACAHCKHMLFYRHGGNWFMGVYIGKDKKGAKNENH